jgi:hypothetical protein
MSEEREPGLAEVLAVWVCFALVAVAIVVTYSRVPARELYHVSGGGLEAGFSRALVFVNFPTALVAIAVAVLAAARLKGASNRPLLAAWTGAAVALCAVTGVPGVVDQGDLDARPVNAVPALGVLLAVALTALAVRRHGLGPGAPFHGWDWARVALAVGLLLAGVPWIAAELGFHLGGVPVLGDLFITGEVRTEPDGLPGPAVHLGHHHGLDGVLLACAALLLSRRVARLPGGRVRLGLGAYLSLMLVYGLANAVQDFWLEQLVKRGTTGTALPSVLRPSLEPAWLGILAAAALLCLAFSRAGRVRAESERRSP